MGGRHSAIVFMSGAWLHSHYTHAGVACSGACIKARVIFRGVTRICRGLDNYSLLAHARRRKLMK